MLIAELELLRKAVDHCVLFENVFTKYLEQKQLALLRQFVERDWFISCT